MAELLGREPAGDFTVVVRDDTGDPVVIRNAPLLRDGTPMPTRYWLVGRPERLAVDRLEASGGVRAAEAEVDPSTLEAAHAAYAAERDHHLPRGWSGLRPAGGVGGARRGVKCLHAHYAWYLAGGDDPVGRWVADRIRFACAGPGEDVDTPAVRAAIDCGTNSTRLLVATRGKGSAGHGSNRPLETLERRMRITRLGEGVDATGALAPAAIERTVAVLRDYRQVMDHWGVTWVRMTATSAARDATNRQEFFDAAEDVIGVRPELLGGEEEGRLSFAGATAELDPTSGPWLVADIGGGSTELAAGPGPDGEPLALRSLDVGCVRVTERFLRSDPPSPAELRAARDHVAAVLEAATVDDPDLGGAATLVGLAGTVAALAGIDQHLEQYDRDRLHHFVLSRRSVEAMLAMLAAEPVAARRLRPGVEHDRADVLVGGAVVLAELMRHFGFEQCLTSESDILDGLVAAAAPPGRGTTGRAARRPRPDR